MGFLDERIILVTGGAGGIGAAISRAIATQGATVAVTDLSQVASQKVADEIIAAGGKASAYGLDVSSPESVKSVVDQVEAKHGLITGAVTAAGVIRIYDFIDLPADKWDLTLNVNLKGTFLVLQEVARRLVAASKMGNLIAISSVAGRGGRKNAVDYAASKAGVISVVRSAALALAAHQITVNAVCPGVVDTPMTRKLHEERSEITGIPVEESIQRMIGSIPIGRIQTPEDVADAVLLFLSPGAQYITGQALNADGGIEMD